MWITLYLLIIYNFIDLLQLIEALLCMCIVSPFFHNNVQEDMDVCVYTFYIYI